MFDRLDLPAFLPCSNDAMPGLISWPWQEPAAHGLCLDLGLRKNTFLFLRLFFPPKDCHPVMHDDIYHITCGLWSKCIWVHSPAWGPTGTEVPLCTPLNSAPSWKSDHVPFAPWNGPSGTGWEDRNWLGARLGTAGRDFDYWALVLGLPPISFIMDTASGIVQTQPLTQETG